VQTYFSANLLRNRRTRYRARVAVVECFEGSGVALQDALHQRRVRWLISLGRGLNDRKQQNRIPFPLLYQYGETGQMDEIGPQTWRRIILLTRGRELERNCGSAPVSDNSVSQDLAAAERLLLWKKSGGGRSADGGSSSETGDMPLFEQCP